MLVDTTSWAETSAAISLRYHPAAWWARHEDRCAPSMAEAASTATYMRATEKRVMKLSRDRRATVSDRPVKTLPPVPVPGDGPAVPSGTGSGSTGLVAERADTLAGRYLRPVLLVLFGLVSLRLIVPPLLVGLPFGWDAVVYTEAARAWFGGGDPWHTSGYAIAFGAPPPSLLPYMPFVWLPNPVVSISWVGIAAASAFYSIRRLRMPLWWLVFPPVSLGIIAGSSALLVLALLVGGGVVPRAAGVVARAYAAVPLVILGQWRPLILAAGAIALTLPMWPMYIADRDRVIDAFQVQTGGGLSALTVPWLIPVAAISLVALGRRRAAWLIVPAFWPDNQLYYASLALPALAASPLVAASIAVPIPGLVAVGLAAQAILERWRAQHPAGSSKSPVRVGEAL
jgi:hypothetical protein